MGLEIDPDLVPKIKLGLHCAQILLALVGWCLSIAVFTGKDAKVVGNNGWTFGVFFLTIPAWLYLIMTPRFARTRKFAEPHAMLAVDVLFTIIWLSAFATQAAYNSSGLCGGACNLSKGVVALGVFVCLLFGATTFVSAYTLTYWKFHETLPGYDHRKLRGGDNNIDPDKAAFSMAPHDDEAYERVNMDDHHDNHGYSETGRYGHANPYSHDEEDDPDRYGALPPRRTELFSQDTEYSSGGVGLPPVSQPYGGSQVGYNEEPAKFPSANYDRST
ncbi:hypothetical protein QQS21_007134 [Conoideocrella luteorostrata]|uniref:Chaperone-binding protein n=1 Tax=Conoideocrella luteorostrata TaxID=1105319 RepID=A0AAJ0CP32_9HYPO|nr:hypothetical protein QQS21_007134 [Conoideocrella luteorostrata]